MVQKRLRLVEEIRITKTSRTVTEAQPVSLRREEVVVEPLEQAVGNADSAAVPHQHQDI